MKDLRRNAKKASPLYIDVLTLIKIILVFGKREKGWVGVAN